jgi:membrane associated rhomboid family serine protease/Zn-finger nucleic acid-binding protein
MSVVTLGSPSDRFFLDVCTRCQFVWLDPNELESLPPAPVPARKEESPPLPQEAREALAIYKARMIAEEQSKSGTNAPDEWWKYLPAMLGWPVEDDNPVKHIPAATITLVVLVILTSLAALSDLKEAVSRFGFVPAELFTGGGLTMISSFFLHGSVFHLIGNMYFLFVFGDNVEDVLGKKRFLLMLLAATVGGDLLHALFAPNSHTPCIGASGGISALIVFYALQFPHARLGWMIYFCWIQVPAYGALGLRQERTPESQGYRGNDNRYPRGFRYLGNQPGARP